MRQTRCSESERLALPDDEKQPESTELEQPPQATHTFPARPLSWIYCKSWPARCWCQPSAGSGGALLFRISAPGKKRQISHWTEAEFATRFYLHNSTGMPTWWCWKLDVPNANRLTTLSEPRFQWAWFGSPIVVTCVEVFFERCKLLPWQQFVLPSVRLTNKTRKLCFGCFTTVGACALLD